MVLNIDMCLPLTADETPESNVDLWEGANNFIRHYYSEKMQLWCRVHPKFPNLYEVVNGAWTGWRDGDIFIVPGGNYIRGLGDMLHGHHHPRIFDCTDWVEENKCGYGR